jgi:hypothetical protein
LVVSFSERLGMEFNCQQTFVIGKLELRLCLTGVTVGVKHRLLRH